MRNGRGPIDLVWLEITGKCQLMCVHCYAESTPTTPHGPMSRDDWIRVIDEAAALGVAKVQFIGGEPTLRPELPDLIGHATASGLRVEVTSNLVRLSARMWAAAALPGVELGTSYYSDDPAEHDEIVGRRGSHARTTATIKTALAQDISVNVGVIDVRAGQRVAAAQETLRDLGVTRIAVDRMRHFGRGASGRGPAVGELCGRCAKGVAAVLPDGSVTPCPMSRWLSFGNVRETSLATLIRGAEARRIRASIAEKTTWTGNCASGSGGGGGGCTP
ncbi:radical SAM protein [Amycolatopsis sp., V23-08]|uniref:Radical SAM protein n=1 Tax=Amycolatopsis heterodermiae TaxID=3110235 RepID=A0ABU5R2E2_9PSEU|nr:radical SAM protein [Amycolatopsis sp., V23-08]MEA5360377.1 radical SAM protein [Amycolatopsis sp., V23-08]